MANTFAKIRSDLIRLGYNSSLVYDMSNENLLTADSIDDPDDLDEYMEMVAEEYGY